MDENKERKCRHEYRLHNDVPGEWRLIWECVRCGKLCICKCFQKAIEASDGVKAFGEGLCPPDIRCEDGKSISIEDLDYCGMACELCRDAPSTHEYDAEEDDEFLRRYGAYVRRTAIELAAAGDKSGPNELEQKAEDVIRDMYGFRTRGDDEIEPGQLPSIVRDLFPKEQMLTDHSPEWLPEGSLDIYLPGLKVALEHRAKDVYRSDDKMKTAATKEEYCRRNGVTLIVFPYYIALDRDTVGWKIAEMRSRG